jgi:large subunit ribosomal protein L25
MARKYGVEELLPPSSKRSFEREEKRKAREEKGMVKVRGHRGERTLKGRYVFFFFFFFFFWGGGLIMTDEWVSPNHRLEMRKEAMEKMPKMIEEWKRRGHGRGWKDWPSGKAKF